MRVFNENSRTPRARFEHPQLHCRALRSAPTSIKTSSKQRGNSFSKHALNQRKPNQLRHNLAEFTTHILDPFPPSLVLFPSTNHILDLPSGSSFEEKRKIDGSSIFYCHPSCWEIRKKENCPSYNMEKCSSPSLKSG